MLPVAHAHQACESLLMPKKSPFTLVSYDLDDLTHTGNSI